MTVMIIDWRLFLPLGHCFVAWGQYFLAYWPLVAAKHKGRWKGNAISAYIEGAKKIADDEEDYKW